MYRLFAVRWVLWTIFLGGFVALFSLLTAMPQADKGANLTLEIIIPRECMISVELKDNAELRGPDREHLKLTGLLVHIKKDCENVNVVKSK